MTPPLIIDMRCLQDPLYAERGIASHAWCAVRHAPAPFIALIDPALPPLAPELAVLPARFETSGYIPGLSNGTVFLNPCPMGPDQALYARLLADERITKAALVYDFIPFDEPARYLHSPAARLDYFTAMAWLKRYDLFFPISQPAEARLKALYGDVTSHITGVALPAWLEGMTQAAPKHILMIGGDDPRKNPEVLLRACAANPALRKTDIIITGGYSLEVQARLNAICPAQFPGRVSREALRALYAGAICVVVPSRAEGFSMPVIEAMAAGAPVLVSDIPPHRALVPDAGLRFGPDDADALVAMLEPVVTSTARRAQIIASQADGWQPYTQDAVASRLWSALYTPERRLTAA